jgi:hypothetical protein
MGRMVHRLFLSEVSSEVWLCAADTRSSDADSQFLKESAAASDDAKGRLHHFVHLIL